MGIIIKDKNNRISNAFLNESVEFFQKYNKRYIKIGKHIYRILNEDLNIDITNPCNLKLMLLEYKNGYLIQSLNMSCFSIKEMNNENQGND